MISKKILLIVSGMVTVTLFVLNWVGTFKLCGGQEYGQCMDFSYGAIINLFPTFPLFLFSLITYKMRDEVYRTWVRFSYVWISLSMILIFFSPEYASSFGITLYPITKGSIAFISSFLFIIISLALILWKYFSLRRHIGQV